MFYSITEEDFGRFEDVLSRKQIRTMGNGEEEPETSVTILQYESVEGKTKPVYVYASYPLKFLHPTHMVQPGHDTCVTVRAFDLDRVFFI